MTYTGRNSSGDKPTYTYLYHILLLPPPHPNHCVCGMAIYICSGVKAYQVWPRVFIILIPGHIYPQGVDSNSHVHVGRFAGLGHVGVGGTTCLCGFKIFVLFNN